MAYLLEIDAKEIKSGNQIDTNSKSAFQHGHPQKRNGIVLSPGVNYLLVEIISNQSKVRNC